METTTIFWKAENFSFYKGFLRKKKKTVCKFELWTEMMYVFKPWNDKFCKISLCGQILMSKNILKLFEDRYCICTILMSS